jgi:hypothetical protein
MTLSNGKSPKFLSEKLSTFEEKEICHKGNLVQNLARKRNSTRNHHKKDLMMVTRLRVGA